MQDAIKTQEIQYCYNQYKRISYGKKTNIICTLTIGGSYKFG